MDSKGSVAPAAPAVDASQHPDNFHVEFSRNIFYVSSMELQEGESIHIIHQGIADVANASAASFVPKAQHIPVKLEVNLKSVVTRRAGTAEMLYTTPLSTIAVAAFGNTPRTAALFGYIADNLRDGLPMGYALHVYRTDSETTASTIVEMLGRAFSGAQRHAQEARSLQSYNSHDSGLYSTSQGSHQPPIPEGGVDLTKAQPSRGDGTSAPPKTVQPVSRASSAPPGHRRTVSDGGNYAPQPAGPSINTNYLMEQTVQNIYRRLHAQTPCLVSDHTAASGRNEPLTFIGNEVITWLVAQRDFHSRHEAVEFMTTLLVLRLIFNVDDEGDEFNDSNSLYRFSLDQGRSAEAPRARSATLGAQHSASQSRSDDASAGAGAPTQTLGLNSLKNTAHKAATLSASAGDVRLDEDDFEAGLGLPGATPPLESVLAHGESAEAFALVHTPLEELQARLEGGGDGALLDHLPVKVRARLLAQCLHNSDLPRARLLLHHEPGGIFEAALNSGGDVLLHWAARANLRHIVMFLLEHGADLEHVNDQQQTPLHKAAARSECLETSMVLVQYGARIRVVNAQGKRPIDDRPELVEAQAVFCRSVIEDVANHTNVVDALQALIRLSQNREIQATLCELVPSVADDLAVSCRGNDRAQELLMTFLDHVMTDQSSSNCDPDVLACVLALTRIPGASRRHALAALNGLVGTQDPVDCVAALARCDLNPLVEIVMAADSDNGAMDMEHLGLSARLLCFVTMLPKCRKTLSSSSFVDVLSHILSHRYMAEVSGEPSAAGPNHELLLAHILTLVGNLCAVLSKQAMYRGLGVDDILRQLLHHTSRRLRRLAARALVILGETDVSGVDVFDESIEALDLRAGDPSTLTSNTEWGHTEVIEDSTHALQTYVGPHSRLAHTEYWRRFLGMNLERFLLALTDPRQTSVWELAFIFIADYWPPLVVLRLLLHRFRSIPAAHDPGVLDPEHRQLFIVIGAWLQTSPEHFRSDTDMLRAMQAWLQEARSRGPVYVEACHSLETAELSPRTDELLSGQLNYQSAAHQAMYRRAHQAVLKGELPLSDQTAVALAAAYIHIEDLARRQPGALVIEPRGGIPSYKMKQVLPPNFARGRDVKQLAEEIRRAYDAIAKRNERDTMHFYLYKYHLEAQSECEFFPVRVVPEQAPRTRLPRLLGISPKRIVLTLEKTRQVEAKYPLQALQRWHIQKVRDRFPRQDRPKASLRHRPERHALCLQFGRGELVVLADDTTITAITDLLWQVTALGARGGSEPNADVSTTSTSSHGQQAGGVGASTAAVTGSIGPGANSGFSSVTTSASATAPTSPALVLPGRHNAASDDSMLGGTGLSATRGSNLTSGLRSRASTAPQQQLSSLRESSSHGDTSGGRGGGNGAGQAGGALGASTLDVDARTSMFGFDDMDDDFDLNIFAPAEVEATLSEPLDDDNNGSEGGGFALGNVRPRSNTHTTATSPAASGQASGTVTPRAVTPPGAPDSSPAGSGAASLGATRPTTPNFTSIPNTAGPVSAGRSGTVGAPSPSTACTTVVPSVAGTAAPTAPPSPISVRPPASAWQANPPPAVASSSDVAATEASGSKTSAESNATTFTNCDRRFKPYMLVSRGVVICDCPASPALPAALMQRSVTPLDCTPHPLELARQLTLYEHDLFKRVRALDLVHKVKSGEAATVASVSAMIRHFNAMTSFVAACVLQETDRERRVALVQKMIALGHRCYTLGNLNGAMEVVAGLGLTPVRRLTETWAGVDPAARKAFTGLERLMSAERNFHRYRALLRKLRPPMVPYFGLYLRDLTMTLHSNQDTLRCGMLNTGKLRDLSVLLEDMEARQQGSYPLIVLPNVRAMLQGLAPVDEDVLFERSYAVQPPSHLRKASSTSFFGFRLTGDSDSNSSNSLRGRRASRHRTLSTNVK